MLQNLEKVPSLGHTGANFINTKSWWIFRNESSFPLYRCSAVKGEKIVRFSAIIVELCVLPKCTSLLSSPAGMNIPHSDISQKNTSLLLYFSVWTVGPPVHEGRQVRSCLPTRLPAAQHPGLLCCSFSLVWRGHGLGFKCCCSGAEMRVFIHLETWSRCSELGLYRHCFTSFPPAREPTWPRGRRLQLGLSLPSPSSSCSLAVGAWARLTRSLSLPRRRSL